MSTPPPDNSWGTTQWGADPSPPRRSKKPWIIGLGILLSLVVVGVLIIVIPKIGRDNTESQPMATFSTSAKPTRTTQPPIPGGPVPCLDSAPDASQCFPDVTLASATQVMQSIGAVCDSPGHGRLQCMLGQKGEDNAQVSFNFNGLDTNKVDSISF